ncbi:MAG: hypothetical protein AAF198_06175 [Pseudomonadota bacterium]
MDGNTDPKQIVCTGDEGSDVWNCAFGTWSADEFGIDSDEPVGDGERLYVRKDLYDAALRRAENAERREAQTHNIARNLCPVAAVSLNGAVSRADGKTFAECFRVTFNGKKEIAPDIADALANLINKALGQFNDLNRPTS